LPKQNKGRILFSVLAAFCGFVLTLLQIFRHAFNRTFETPVLPSMENIGNQMLGVEANGFALPFEVVSILLLAAMIGCIVIALRSKPETV
jgi:NADH-quinone oxidoreductase subunit J